MSTYTQITKWGIEVDTMDNTADLDDILDEVDPEYIVEYLSSRRIGQIDAVVLRKLLVRLLCLPEWYYTDEDAVVREIRKLF